MVVRQPVVVIEFPRDRPVNRFLSLPTVVTNRPLAQNKQLASTRGVSLSCFDAPATTRILMCMGTGSIESFATGSLLAHQNGPNIFAQIVGQHQAVNPLATPYWARILPIQDRVSGLQKRAVMHNCTGGLNRSNMSQCLDLLRPWGLPPPGIRLLCCTNLPDPDFFTALPSSLRVTNPLSASKWPLLQRLHLHSWRSCQLAHHED